MLSRSDELRFYEAEKRILRQFEDDKDVQDYLEYLENQDEELFIRVSDLKIETGGLIIDKYSIQRFKRIR